MTDMNIDGLKAMLDMVEARGEVPSKLIIDAFGVRRLPNGWDVIVLIKWILRDGIEAMGAAKVLHEAVLPGFDYGISKHSEEDYPCAWVEAQGGSEPTAIQMVSNADIARAWLIAILRALISDWMRNA